MENKNNSRFGFTLAEMMIVMLILTIILAAFAPLMTKRNKAVDLSSPWRWASNNSDIYYGTGSNQTAMIGKKSKADSDPNARLLIKSGDRPALTLEGNSKYNDDKFISLFADKGDPVHDSGFWDYGKLCFGSVGQNNFDCGNVSTSYGFWALENNTTGNRNTAIGNSALNDNTTGSDNVAVGVRALSINVSGSENVAIGHRAMRYSMWGSRNVAIGKNALQYLYHHDNPSATELATNARDNVAIGYESGEGVQMGHDVIAIGTKSCQYATGSNKICIGSNSGPEGFGQGSGNNDHYIWLGDRNAEDISLYIGSKPLKQIIKDNSSTSGSDKRLKNISGENKYGLDVIRNLKTYNFTYKEDKKKTPHIGLIAQDLQKYIPEAIEKDEKGFLSIRCDFVRYTMFNAIKQLDVTVQKIVAQVKDVITKVTNLETQIKALQKENKELKAKIQALEKQNKSYDARLKKLESKL